MQYRASSAKTTASRLKALLLHTQARHGRAEADALLLKLRLDREDLEDETRLVSVQLWHRGLVAFASRFGRDEIRSIMPAIVAPENLGVWTRVLRGAETPTSAFLQLTQHGGDAGPTERWSTLRSSPSTWAGRVTVAQSAEFERDGLCQLARVAELSSIPMLFGLPAGKVEILGDVNGDQQEFSVSWRSQSHSLLPVAAVLGAGSGSGLGWLEARGPGEMAVWVGGGLALGSGFGYLLAQQRRRGNTVASQRIRIQALERAAILKDARIASTHQFSSGSVIAGQYRLGEQLGTGASGAIWEAERIADGASVAIKLLRTAVAHDTVAADRLRREAAALGLAWHPNVVEVYEDGVLPDGTSYLVMERLYGESLARRLKRRGPLTPEELLPVALQVCDALGAVHAAGVVHRDVKPSNIFLAQESQDKLANSPVRLSLSTEPTRERVKLLDFGVAQVEWAETRLTNSGAALGTPGYMSPEQEQGIEIDHRSDIFSVGGVIYECLSGAPPPVTQEGVKASAPASDRPESGVQRSLREVPEGWRQLVDKAMAYHPRDRYGDWRALRDALVALREDAEQSSRNSQHS